MCAEIRTEEDLYKFNGEDLNAVLDFNGKDLNTVLNFVKKEIETCQKRDVSFKVTCRVYSILEKLYNNKDYFRANANDTNKERIFEKVRDFLLTCLGTVYTVFDTREDEIMYSISISIVTDDKIFKHFEFKFYIM